MINKTIKVKVKVGDIVRHKVNKNLYARVLCECPTNPDKWFILYKSRNNQKGHWQKSNTEFVERPSHTSHITDTVCEKLKILDTKPYRSIIDNLDTSSLEARVAASTANYCTRLHKIITQKMENIMQASIEHKTLINGHDIDGMEACDIIYHIKNVEDDINDLKAIKTESVYIKQEIARLRAFVKEATGLLDEKFATNEPKK